MPSCSSLVLSLPALLSVLVVTGACGSSSSTTTAPTPVSRCAISLSMSEATMPAGGAAGTVGVTASRECAWTASVEGAWLSIRSGGSGQGDGQIEFASAVNPDPQVRTGAIVVNGSRAQITQSAGECVIRLDKSSADFPTAGGAERIGVIASSAQCTWTATADSPWIEITSGANGRGSAPVMIAVAPTTGPPRAGSLTIAGQRFSVSQSQGCTYAIDRSSHTATAAGGAGTVTVATAAACPWTAASNVPWITVTPATGAGAGTVTFTVAPTQGAQRTGTAVIAGQLFTVTQSPGCAYEVGPTSHNAGASGGTASVNIATAAGCGWTAGSNVPWLTISGPASGAGPGQVTFSIAPTTGPPRSGTLTVAGQQVTVTQSQGCSWTIAPQSESVPSAGGTGRVTVTAGDGCAWTASSNVPWATITSGASGSGNGQVQFSVAGTTGPSRSGTLTIAGQTFTIQQGEGCTIRLSSSSLSINDDGGQRSFEVETAAGCPWTATTSTSWLTITSGSSGSGDGTVRFTVAANSGPSRTGTITAGGQTFRVEQGNGCAYSLSRDRLDVAAGGGNATVNVTAGNNCAWTAASNASWLTVTSGANDSGNGTVGFSAAANSGPERSGTLTIAGRTFTVRQASGCTYAISPASQAVPGGGGTASVNVDAPSSCSWTSSSNAPWIAVTSGASGTGDGVVRLTAEPNTGAARTGTVTIAGRTFTITQESGCTFTVAPEAISVGAGGGGARTDVTTAAGCAWTAVSNTSWISVTSGASGSGSGPVQLNVEPNTGAARTGTVTVAGRTVTITQAGGCTFAVAPEAISVGAGGGGARTDVTTSAGCAWTAVSNTSWISVTSGASGSGSGPVQLNVEPNTGAARTGTVTVAGRTVTITQDGGCTFAVAPEAIAVAAGGGGARTDVTTSAGCGWTAVSNAPWISVTAGASGSGSGPVQLSVAPNTGAARTGTVTVAGRTVTITQDGGCTYTVAPEAITAPAAGSAPRVDVTTSAGCGWTAASNAPWISVTAGASGSGTGAVELSVQAHAGPARSGTVTVAGRTVTVSQESGCTIALSPTSQSVPAAGGTGSVTVTTAPGCGWTAASANAWIVVTAGASGSGDGAVQFTVEANATGAPRTGTIVIGGQTFTVNQQ